MEHLRSPWRLLSILCTLALLLPAAFTSPAESAVFASPTVPERSMGIRSDLRLDAAGQATVYAATPGMTSTVRIESKGSASPASVWRLYLPVAANSYDSGLYDDFEDAAYDIAFNPILWRRLGDPGCDTRQWAGSLLFVGCDAPGGTDLYLDQPQERSLPEVEEFETRLKFNTGHVSGYASVKMQVSVDEGGGQGWWTQCTIAAQDLLAPGFLCDVSTYAGDGRTTEYLTPLVPVAFDTWYTAKIEANPNTAELSFFLDGTLLGKHTPSNAAALLVASNLHPKVGVWNSAAGTTATRYVDEVRITPAGP